MIMKKICIAMLLVLLLPFSLFSQDGGTATKVYDKWQVRVRALAIVPDEGAVIEAIGGDVDISTAVIPELDFPIFLRSIGRPNLFWELPGTMWRRSGPLQGTLIWAMFGSYRLP
jgi:hypothetical protein